MRLSRLACAIPLLTYVSAAPPGQVPLKPESGEETGEDDNDSSKTRPFYGRFLHITGTLIFLPPHGILITNDD